MNYSCGIWLVGHRYSTYGRQCLELLPAARVKLANSLYIQTYIIYTVVTNNISCGVSCTRFVVFKFSRCATNTDIYQSTVGSFQYLKLGTEKVVTVDYKCAICECANNYPAVGVGINYRTRVKEYLVISGGYNQATCSRSRCSSFNVCLSGILVGKPCELVSQVNIQCSDLLTKCFADVFAQEKYSVANPSLISVTDVCYCVYDFSMYDLIFVARTHPCEEWISTDVHIVLNKLPIGIAHNR